MPKKRATTPGQTNPDRTKVKQASSAIGPSTKRHFEFVKGTSSKFWEIELSGTTQTVRFGRIGTDGQLKTTKFADAGKAQASCVKLIGQKVKKGYIESSAPGKSSSKKPLPKKAKKEEAKTVTRKKPTGKKTTAGKSVAGTLQWRQKKRKKEVQFQATIPKQATQGQIVAALEEFWSKVWQAAVEVDTGSDTILLVCELWPEIGRIAGYRALRAARYLKPIDVSVVIDQRDVQKRYDELSEIHELHGDRVFERHYDKLTAEICSWLKASAKSVSKVDRSFAKRASIFWIDSPEEITPQNVSWMFGKKLSKKELAKPEAPTAFPACVDAIFGALRMQAAKREEKYSPGRLYLYSTATKDQTLSLLTDVPDLESLSLFSTAVSDQGLKYVTRLSNLRVLELGGTKVTDNGLKECGKLTKLEELSLWGLPLSGKGLRYLESLKSLTDLELSNTGLSDRDLTPLLKLKKLECLDLGSNKITDEGVKVLSGIKSLETLDLSRTQITDQCVPYLTRLPKLDTLYVDDTNFTAEGLAQLRAAGLTRLRGDFD